MPHHYAEIAFTPIVKTAQAQLGSRNAYARWEKMPDDTNNTLGESEVSFIAARNSFYMATVNEGGWPYIQHRGGPTGFVSVIDEKTIGFADYRGNRQYISVGNLMANDRVSLFFMDYSSRSRLKLFGRGEIIGPDDQETLSRLRSPGYPARVERGFIIKVAAFDWNCPQHISQRFTVEEMQASMLTLRARISQLEAQLARRPAQQTMDD